MESSPRAGREGDVLAVVSQSGPSVSFFDAASDRHLGSVHTHAEPHELCFDPVQRLLWCTMTYHSGFYRANSGRRTELTVIDPDTRRVVEVVDLAPEHAPHGIALDAAGGCLYVSVESGADRSGGVVVIDTETRRPVGRIDTDAPGSHWVAVDAAGTTGCVANKEAPFVSVLDLKRGILTAKVEVPGCEGIAVSADGTYAYVATPYQGSVSPEEAMPPGIKVVDLRTVSVVDTLPVESAVMPVHLTSTGKLLAGEVRTEHDPVSRTSRMTPGRLTVFSAGTRRRIADFEVGLCPLTIASSPDGRIAYVACYASATVDLLDLETPQHLTRLGHPALGASGTHGLAYIPAPS
ncbi:surface layer protein [Streptomyces sp. IMTB 2501]|uniref:YncE family protein n=1 Tax=Streptomyces sp. IMTB 2501 TaxID=1776340 RepID=UPI00096F950A|nr:YncE family protein [Streptomyces sp. IMTB 2501]OLZ72090.1 surface layer protein [Streptomyces sp. IMTB 2501]